MEISFYNKKDSLLRTFKSGGEKEESVSAEKGMNEFVWDGTIKGVDKIDDMILQFNIANRAHQTRIAIVAMEKKALRLLLILVLL